MELGLLLDVLIVPDLGSDVTVPSTVLRPTAGTPLASVFFALRVDGVSQEIDEKFNITLSLNPETTVPVDFYPTITVSIKDQDGEFLNSLIIRFN